MAFRRKCQMSDPSPLLTTVSTRLAAGELVLDEGTDMESFLKGVEYAAELQREFNSRKTKNAIKKAKEAGVVIGKPKGSKTPHEHTKLYPYEPLIKEMLSQGATYGAIAEKTGVDRHTVKSHIEKYLK